ncbi:hypothetical protein HU675_0033835 [Bradyrhizobium septentrionale]|uniref:hypothetical protein n=1 Tax=Bradyrhizobium septentrionale TaxID=1404411 RepID=UPI001596658B|nr:hypothetical protein [Bradyrhizobium septentrionale]UGY22919.1 hypothetical protein HU675_0033835 [Bradyrhizobium septentrionale]
MTQVNEGIIGARKTPADATDFEREQLRFFLPGEDLAVKLHDLNPSLAWLSVFNDMKLIENERQLIAWIQNNFGSVEAIREVVANLAFFGPDTATFLKNRLDAQASALSPLLVTSWNLVFRHMRTAKQGFARAEWFDLLPQLKRGEHDNIILERLAEVLRPKLKLTKPFIWREQPDDKTPEKPSDLMSINYEIEEGLSSSDVLAVWPQNADVNTDTNLLRYLNAALIAALADATDVGVESNDGYSTTDSGVPSIAKHSQNEYRSGFQAIVRVIAEIWSRVVQKSPTAAIAFVEEWRRSNFRLIRRLALFAAMDKVVPAALVANLLIDLPIGDLFLSSVEVQRLIPKRWIELDETQQEAILSRVCGGPPRSWYHQGAEGDRAMDHLRYDALSNMVRHGLSIGDTASLILREIQIRYPQWMPKPPEQAGFRVWHEGGFRDRAAESDDLTDVTDENLVAEAQRIVANANFMDGNKWEGLVLKDPDRAFRGLSFEMKHGNWPQDFWRQLLWSRTPYLDPGTEPHLAVLLANCPLDVLATFAPAAAAWLDEHAKTLSANLLWPLWDHLTQAARIETPENAHE